MESANSAGKYRYRFVYFNTRGAGELCRLTLVAGFGMDRWEDVRCPLTLTAAGWKMGAEFRQAQQAGLLHSNLDRLPVLQVVEMEWSKEDGKRSNPPQALATIGQSHAILRFLVQQPDCRLRVQKNNVQQMALDEAKVDCFCECVRDVRTAWYRIKREPGGKAKWFDATTTTATTAGASENLTHNEESLASWCRLLENAIPSNSKGRDTDAAPLWFLGNHKGPTVADVAIYHLLSATTSLMTGSTVSFFDNETAERIQACYVDACPRLEAIVNALPQEIPAIRDWEEQRPDTIS